VGSRSVAPDDDPHLTTAHRAASLYRTLRRSEAGGFQWTSQQLLDAGLGAESTATVVEDDSDAQLRAGRAGAIGYGR